MVLSHGSSTSKRLLILFAFSYLSNSNSLMVEGNDLDKVLEPQIKAVRSISEKMKEIFQKSNWCAASSNCDDEPCLQHGCNGSNFGKSFKCSENFFVMKECPVLEDSSFRNVTVCESSKNPNGVLLNMKKPVFYSDIGTIESGKDGSEMKIKATPLRRDACQLKKLSDTLVSAYYDNSLKVWIYAATTNGAYSIFPGYPLCRGNEGPGDNCGYNPTRRPWYIRAASGPKDVVFLVDKTSLKGKTLEKSIAVQIESLSPKDFVSIVFFNESSVETIASDGLRKATKDHRSYLINNITEIGDNYGSGNVTLAFEKAFEILTPKNENSSNCRKIIVLLSGGSDTCLNSCEHKKFESCTCIDDLRKLIREKQDGLNEFVSIITFTEDATGEMEKLSRTIACDEKNQGIWKKVIADDSEDTAMSTYSTFVGNRLFLDKPKTLISPIYEDAFGLGKLFTVSLPTYVDSRFIGVAAADVELSEVLKSTKFENEEEIAAEIEKHNENFKCPVAQKDEGNCLIRELRRQEENSGECPEQDGEKQACYYYQRKAFFSYKNASKFDAAAKHCENIDKNAHYSGSLAISKNEKEAHILAALASAHGSWIGAKSTRGYNTLQWMDGSNVTDGKNQKFGFADEYEIDRAISKIENKYISGAGLSVDRRGIKGNWILEPISQKREYICQVEISRDLNVEEVLQSKPFDGRCEKFNLTECAGSSSSRDCSEKDNAGMNEAKPLCQQEGKSYTEFDRFCCGGRSEEDKCLAGDKCEETTPAWKIAIIVLASLLVILILAYFIRHLVLRIIRYFVIRFLRSQKEETDEPNK